MRNILSFLSVLLLGCGPSKPQTAADAGPDTSCGLDCALQEYFGFTLNRCFEYSSTQTKASPPSLAVVVRPVEKLEGGVSVLPLEYSQGGQIRMTDYFHFKDGSLALARRTFGPGQSVTYKNPQGFISGVPWLETATSSGQTVENAAEATVLGFGKGGSESTTYRVVFEEATGSALQTPLEKYEQGLKMVFFEEPDHGVDTRRTFVPNVGFIQLSSAFSPSAQATSLPYVLQNLRDIKPGDAPCGLESP